MAEVIRMPKMSDTMEEGVIVEWHKKVGETSEPCDILVDVETDKATMELEAYDEGTLLYIGIEKGQAVPVNAIIAVVGKEGEDYKSLLEDNGSDSAPKEEAPTETQAEEKPAATRSEEHTSELQSRENLVCRLLLEKKKTQKSSGNATQH